MEEFSQMNKPEKKRAILSLRGKGKTQNEIAEIFNISRGKLQYYLGDSGPSTRGELLEKEMIDMREQGKTYKEIGDSLKLNPSTVIRRLNKMKKGRKELNMRLIEIINTAKELQIKSSIAGCLLLKLGNDKNTESVEALQLIEQAAEELSNITKVNEEQKIYSAYYYLSKLENR